MSTSLAQLDLARAYLRAIGRSGGLSTSPAKQAAVRINGRNGGRPRKDGQPRRVAFAPQAQAQPTATNTHTTEDGIYVYDLSR